MKNTVTRRVSPFQLSGNKLIWVKSSITPSKDKLLLVGDFKDEDKTKGACIDNPPERFRDDNDVLLIKDMNNDGYLDAKDAEASLQQIRDFLFNTQYRDSISAPELIDRGYVALTHLNLYGLLVNQPHDGTLSWVSADGKKQTLVGLMQGNCANEYLVMAAKIKESDSAKTE